MARVARTAIEAANFNAGDILVVQTTNVEYVEAIRKASGIITEDENVTCHAAVIGLRLGIPVIVGMKDATKIIRNGGILTLDAQRGIVSAGATNPNVSNI